MITPTLNFQNYVTAQEAAMAATGLTFETLPGNLGALDNVVQGVNSLQPTAAGPLREAYRSLTVAMYVPPAITGGVVRGRGVEDARIDVCFYASKFAIALRELNPSVWRQYRAGRGA